MRDIIHLSKYDYQDLGGGPRTWWESLKALAQKLYEWLLQSFKAILVGFGLGLLAPVWGTALFILAVAALVLAGLAVMPRHPAHA